MSHDVLFLLLTLSCFWLLDIAVPYRPSASVDAPVNIASGRDAEPAYCRDGLLSDWMHKLQGHMFHPSLAGAAPLFFLPQKIRLSQKCTSLHVSTPVTKFDKVLISRGTSSVVVVQPSSTIAKQGADGHDSGTRVDFGCHPISREYCTRKWSLPWLLRRLALFMELG